MIVIACELCFSKVRRQKKAVCSVQIAGEKTAKRSPVKTKNKCMRCGIALCLPPCFREYHSNIATNSVGRCIEFADVLIHFCVDFLVFLFENLE